MVPVLLTILAVAQHITVEVLVPSHHALEQQAIILQCVLDMELVVHMIHVLAMQVILALLVTYLLVMEQTHNQLLFVPLTVLALQKIIANVQLIGLALRVV